MEIIEGSTERKSGIGLAGLSPEERDTAERFFGPYGAESMVLASDPDYVLWTDDLIQAQVAAREFGSQRVWTQLVLASLADSGLLTTTEFAEASAKLVGMEFTSTLIDGTTILAGFQLAAWNPGRQPAAQILRTFADLNLNLQSLCNVYIVFTMMLFREPLATDLRCTTTRAFLDTISSRPGAMALLQSLRDRSSAMFGLNGVGRDEFDRCFDRWLELRGRPIIYLG